jgi:EAL domain-containing protein (putative c-di-GMP-specific phosphodiesterase class I)
VLSPEFNRLARLMTDTDRRNLTIELNAVDLMADYDGYLFVRSYLSDIGVKVCLDGTDQHSLPGLVDAGLAADMIKIRWSRDADMVALAKPDNAFAQAIAAFGPLRAVLCGCSEARAIEFGHALGLDLFQGRYVDQLMNPNAIRMA